MGFGRPIDTVKLTVEANLRSGVRRLLQELQNEVYKRNESCADLRMSTAAGRKIVMRSQARSGPAKRVIAKSPSATPELL